MAPILDFHCHVFPAPLESLISPGWRRQTRSWLQPYTRTVHSLQTLMRLLPETARKGLDELGSLVSLPGMLVASSPADLQESMADNRVDYSLVIAHPPIASNEFVLDASHAYKNLIPVVNIPVGAPKPAARLKSYVKKGAKALKIHAAADGEGVDSPRYKALLRTASDLAIPVILHTGCIYNHIYYRDPEQGHAERFAKWFTAYPNTQFILAHMNFHSPAVAMDLMEDHPNVYTDTSWQPAEVIGEAVRRLGSERILFGTDWPFVGNNLSVGLGRVRKCVDAGTLTETDAQRILGDNALKLLGMLDATGTGKNLGSATESAET